MEDDTGIPNGPGYTVRDVSHQTYEAVVARMTPNGLVSEVETRQMGYEVTVGNRNTIHVATVKEMKRLGFDLPTETVTVDDDDDDMLPPSRRRAAKE